MAPCKSAVGRSRMEFQPHQFIELPLTANSLMPAVLREMDCALQVSRCEACTNLPAKEAMACGVPVILANNTGTRDLIDTDNCLALTSQDPVTGPDGFGTDGWGESRVEEIVARTGDAVHGHSEAETHRRPRRPMDTGTSAHLARPRRLAEGPSPNIELT